MFDSAGGTAIFQKIFPPWCFNDGAGQRCLTVCSFGLDSVTSKTIMYYLQNFHMVSSHHSLSLILYIELSAFVFFSTHLFKIFPLI